MRQGGFEATPRGLSTILLLPSGLTLGSSSAPLEFHSLCGDTVDAGFQLPKAASARVH